MGNRRCGMVLEIPTTQKIPKRVIYELFAAYCGQVRTLSPLILNTRHTLLSYSIHQPIDYRSNRASIPHLTLNTAKLSFMDQHLHQPCQLQGEVGQALCVAPCEPLILEGANTDQQAPSCTFLVLGYLLQIQLSDSGQKITHHLLTPSTRR